MNAELIQIPNRILEVALGALIQANHHAVFYDQYSSGWPETAVLSTATAAELVLKAIVAKEHPLLIFRDLFDLENPLHEEITVERLIERGRTYGLEHMPKLLWVTTGERIPDQKLFEKLRLTRNSIQHFCAPTNVGDLRDLARQFIYKNIDPLLKRHFSICAIEYHQDHDIGYDYIVDCLVRNELLFSIPDNFSIGEVDLRESLAETSSEYQHQLTEKLKENGYKLSDFMK